MTLIKRIPVGEGRFYKLAYSPDGYILAADIFLKGPPLNDDAEHIVVLFDVETGRILKQLDIDARYGLVFSPDGKMLAAGQRERRGRQVRANVVLYNLENGEQVAVAQHEWEFDADLLSGEPQNFLFDENGTVLFRRPSQSRWLSQAS